MSCISRILSDINTRKLENEELVWGCQEMIILMKKLEKIQQSSDEIGKKKISECLIILINTLFPRDYYLDKIPCICVSVKLDKKIFLEELKKEISS